VSRDSSVGIVTGYGLDGPETNPGKGEIFCTCPDRSWGPPNLLYNGYRVFPGVKSGRGVTLTPHPFYCSGHERVELYLYSPYAPYGLCRTSVPVQSVLHFLTYVLIYVFVLTCLSMTSVQAETCNLRRRAIEIDLTKSCLYYITNVVCLTVNKNG
jgi:hypothetical protein